jgi:hypothetical protein
MYRVIDEHRTREFAWGVNDCCLFVARVRDAMTGSDIESQILLQYQDQASAQSFIATYGDLKTVASKYLGEPVEGRAVRGDAVLVDGGLGDALGIWDGKVALCMGPRGLRELPRSEVRCVWRVR